jgi:nucleoside-diphosphate-sugar epimerase
VGGRLAFVKGDVSVPRHVSALMAELTAPLTGKTSPTEGALRTGRGLIGIIHLAGISRDIWCASRPAECEALNVKGTTNLFEALDEATRSVSGSRRPWFLHFSSLDVYEAETGVVPRELEGLTPLGRSKVRAERALEEAYHTHLSHLSSSSSDADAPPGEGIRTIILRPSTIYGHPTDIQDRLVPALVRNALADLPVQVMHDRPVDFIEVGDALDGVVGAVERLMGREAVQETKMEQLAGEKRQLPVSGPMFETYDLVSGYTATPKQLLDMIMRLTQSLSPIQDYTTQPTTTKLPLMTLDPSPSLRSKLGFQPSVSLDQGIAGYVSTVRQSVTDWARDYLGAECPESRPYGDPMVIHDADRRNKNIQRLAGCTANIGVNHDGWIHHVKCGDSTCDADNIKTSSYNWNQSIFTILPYGAEPPSGDDAGGGKWGWAFGLLGTERKDGASTPMRVQFVEGNTKKVLGFVKREAPEGGRQYVKLGLFDPVEAGNASEIVTVFEPRVRMDQVVKACR